MPFGNRRAGVLSGRASAARHRERRHPIKIVLDITRLVAEGRLTETEAERLRSLAARDTGSLAINVLMAFGAVAVAAGILALDPSFATGAAIGVALVLVGLFVSSALAAHWALLGTANTIIGALLLAGGVIGFCDGNVWGFLFALALLLALALGIRSAFLMALAPLALAAALGSSTGYFHASYELMVREPAITILVFTLSAAASYLVSLRVAPAYERLAIVFARVSLILVNFGFWVGSLWGDYPGESWVHGDTYSGAETWETWQAWRAGALHVPDTAYITAWAVVIIAVGVWAARANRRWVVTMAAVFGAIHFYTQWFERLGAEPWAIIVAGLTIVAIAVGLWRYNLARPETAKISMENA